MIVKTSSGARIFAISSGDASMVSPSGIGLPRRPSLKAHCSSQGTPEESLQALRLPSLHERARDYANLVIWSTRTRLTLRRASPDYPRKAGDVLSVCPCDRLRTSPWSRPGARRWRLLRARCIARAFLSERVVADTFPCETNGWTECPRRARVHASLNRDERPANIAGGALAPMTAVSLGAL